jgi:hypothetical protein
MQRSGLGLMVRPETSSSSFLPTSCRSGVVFVVDLHGHDLPYRGQPPTLKGAHEQEGALI